MHTSKMFTGSNERRLVECVIIYIERERELIFKILVKGRWVGIANVKLNNFDDVIGNRKPSLESFERGLHVKNTILDLKINNMFKVG